MDRYGVIGGDDDDLENDDKERSRGIPSRTEIGRLSAFGEKHGWALAPLNIFIFHIPHWGYRNMSNAKIEIMMLDLPRVEYGNTKNKTTKKDIAEWEQAMETIKSVTPQKINLNKYNIDG